MPVQCLKRPCAIFDEFEPVRKIRLVDHNFNKTGSGIDQRLSLSENTTLSTVPQQTTCLVVPQKRKRQLQPDDDSHGQCTLLDPLLSSRKKAKMVIQARDPTSSSVDIYGGHNVGGICFESDDSVSGRPGLGLERSNDIYSKSSTARDTEHLETQTVVQDDASVFNCFNFWRSPVPKVDLLEELCLGHKGVPMAEVDGMADSDDSAAAPSGEDIAKYSDFSFWKVPMEILDLD